MLNFNKGLYITIAVIVLILFVMGSCVTIIPTGYTGVK